MFRHIARALVSLVDPTKRLGLAGDEDEFSVRRGGRHVGIFKDFACPPPVDPPDLSRPEIQVYREFDWWRLFSECADRALWQWMRAHPLPERKVERVRELVRRLYLVFQLQAGFYYIERQVERYPGASGGDLEKALLFLPSAFADEVIATEGHWEDSWSALKKRTVAAMAKEGPKKTALLRLAALAEVPPHHLIFAANFMESFLERRGGKKGDVAPEEALRTLGRLSLTPQGLGDMNARIRLSTFLPLEEEDDNFSGGSRQYAPVRATVQALLHEVSDPEAWQESFRAEYFGEILPQLSFFDTVSSKGRLLLELMLAEGRSSFALPCRQELNSWGAQVADQLDFPQPIQPLGGILPRALVGEKAFGLGLAATAGYPIWHGCVLTIPAVRAIVETGANWNQVLPRLPKRCWAVRSSGLDEGTARGVYESRLRVPREAVSAAVQKVVSSFYAPKARAFRHTAGLGDALNMAVVIQPYRRLPGGVCQGGKSFLAPTAALVTSGQGRVREEAEAHELLNTFPAGQVEFQRDHGHTIVLQLEVGQHQPREFVRSGQRLEMAVEDSGHLAALEPPPNTSIVLHLGGSLTGFDQVLMRWLALHGPVIEEVRHSNPPGPGSHLANLCRSFGIALLKQEA